ncbi:hypothetical protein [Mycobacterium paragordonae]|uniref:Uncharacterized protein n=1 Tax=Mycobacterium paragordonae TaxID=1389713 RepID=A0AAJ1W4R0_9MYCO|nr:hypothetical protein [Mycobacterium paragordonae]MDP7739730.1 hypothetical protein [Mycobacterium paragordonae]
MTALVTAAVVIGALAEFSYWRENQPDMTGLTSKVMDSMNQSLSTDNDFAKMGLRVKSISVMRVARGHVRGASHRSHHPPGRPPSNGAHLV